MNAGYLLVDLIVGGGTENIPVRNPYEGILLLGSGTLTSSWTIQSTGTPRKGHHEHIMYRATLTFSGNTLTIFGKAIPAVLEGKPFDVDAVYDGAAWQVSVKAATIESEAIDGLAIKDATITGSTKLVDNSVVFTKLEPLLEGEMLIGNVSDEVSAVFAGGDAKIMIGDGVTSAPQTIAGDVNVDNVGASVIQPNSVTEAMLAFSLPGQLKVAAATLNKSDIDAIFTTPKIILSSVAANEAVSVVAVAIDYFFNSAAFTWDNDLEIQNTGGGILATILEADLEVGANKTWSFVEINQRDMIKAAGLHIKAASGNPTGGGTDSTYKINVLYLTHKF